MSGVTQPNTAEIHRVALYLRSATQTLAPSESDPILSEERKLREACEFRELGQVVETYRDVGSGVSLARPGLQSLLSRVASGSIDVVMVSDLSRLSRNMLHLAAIVELMHRSGCVLRSQPDSFDSFIYESDGALSTLCTCSAGPGRKYVAHHIDCLYVKVYSHNGDRAHV